MISSPSFFSSSRQRDHRELPGQVVFERGGLGEDVFKARELFVDLAHRRRGARSGVELLDIGFPVEVVFAGDELFFLGLGLDKGFFIAQLLGFGIVGLRLHSSGGLVFALRSFSQLLEDGVFHHLLGDDFLELHAIQLKQLDGLLQLGRHHQLLAEF